MASTVPSPGPDEYAPYFEKYTYLIEGDLDLEFLEYQPARLRQLLAELTEEQSLFSYGEGKWTIRESLGHVIETERVFLYRALRMSRSDGVALPGFDQDGFVAKAQHNSTNLESLLTEFDAVRNSTLAFVRNLPTDLLSNMGEASGHSLSCRATLHMLAGHVEHHIKIFKDVYLSQLGIE